MTDDDLPPDAARCWVIHLDLPDARPRTCRDLHAAVFGVRLDHGAKPWPWFRAPETGRSWSLSGAYDLPLDRVVWLVDLDQLGFHPTSFAP